MSAYETKISSITYLTNKVHTYSVSKDAKEKELNIIQDKLHNSEFIRI
jgi:hypothetical protein